MSSSTPEVTPAQSKDAQDSSKAKNSCFPLQLTRPKKQAAQLTPVIGWQPGINIMHLAHRSQRRSLRSCHELPDATGTGSHNSAVEREAPPPLLPSDSTPAPTTPDQADPEKEKVQDSTIPRVPDAQERWRKRRLWIIHIRIARSFTWASLSFPVRLPERRETSRTRQKWVQSRQLGSKLVNHITNLGLFAICWLWYVREDEPEWLFTNLFSVGLINALSGLIYVDLQRWFEKKG